MCFRLNSNPELFFFGNLFPSSNRSIDKAVVVRQYLFCVYMTVHQRKTCLECPGMNKVRSILIDGILWRVKHNHCYHGNAALRSLSIDVHTLQ